MTLGQRPRHWFILSFINSFIPCICSLAWVHQVMHHCAGWQWWLAVFIFANCDHAHWLMERDWQQIWQILAVQVNGGKNEIEPEQITAIKKKYNKSKQVFCCSISLRTTLPRSISSAALTFKLFPALSLSPGQYLQQSSTPPCVTNDHQSIANAATFAITTQPFLNSDQRSQPLGKLAKLDDQVQPCT